MNQLPNFFEINLDTFNQNLNDMLNRHRQQIKRLTEQTDVNWQNTMATLEDMDDELGQFWSPVSHLHSVVNNDKLREVYKEAIGAISQYSTEVGQNKALYETIKAIKPENPTQTKILADEQLAFELSGVALAKEKKARFAEIQNKLSQLSTQFETNLLDATQAWKKEINNSERLKGLPEHALNTAKSLGKDKGNYILTLDYPCFSAVMSFCEDEALRREMHEAYVTRASELGPNANAFDNSDLINEILALKHEKSQLLGFENYAALSLAKKMAPSTQKVMEFLIELADKSKPQAEHEFKEVEDFAGKKLNAWDIAFYSEKLQQEKFSISQETLRPYFPQSKVLKGMFAIANKLYDIHIEKKSNVSTWHPDVEYYELYNTDGSLKGGLYVDLYARENKRGGAWMDDCIPYRKLKDGQIQTPVAFLTCNFAPGSENEQAYLSHDEVITLFHEFGHCLHHLMTNIPYLSASGINGVEWDAVELPSQFFENFCWQKTALIPLSEHKQSKEKLPDDLFDKLYQAKNFQSAMAMMRQLEFALFDFIIHKDYLEEQPKDVLETLDQLRNKYSVLPQTNYNRFPNSFSHIFAGGYAAGYYSYKWAEVLSSDAFAKFEEHGIFDKSCGQDFLNEILARGSSRKALESFVAFRGREPKIDALLRHSGISTML